MIIGFDAKRAFHNKTGLGNYSRFLIEGLAKNHPNHELILFTPTIKDNSIFSTVNNYKNIQVIQSPKKIPTFFWRTFLLSQECKKHKCDLFHGLTGELPFGNWEIPTTVTIHDMIHKRLPDLFPVIDRQIYWQKNKYAAKIAQIIQANSQQTKQDIIKFLDVDPEKIQVIPHSVDPIFEREYSEQKIGEVKKKYKLPKEFLLTVGRIEERKNGLLIAKALIKLPQEIKLVFVGKPTEYKTKIVDFIEKNDLKDRVVFLENVVYEDLPLIYKNALALVFPSKFEGFGLPILEALKTKTPVITTKGSSLVEVGGPDSIYIDADNTEELIENVIRIYTDPSLRLEMISKSFDFARKFSLDIMVEQTYQVYKKLTK